MPNFNVVPAMPQAPRAPKLESAQLDLIEAREIPNFDGLRLVAAQEKKPNRKGDINNRNEDATIGDPQTGLFGVADGMGGEGEKGAGAEASACIQRNLPGLFRTNIQESQKQFYNQIKDDIRETQYKNLGITDEDLDKLSEELKNTTDSNQKILLETVLEQRKHARKEADTNLDTFFHDHEGIARKTWALLKAIQNVNPLVEATGGKSTVCVGFIEQGIAVFANVGDSGAIKRRVDDSVVSITKEDSLLNGIDRTLLKKMKADPDKKFPVPVTRELIIAIGGTEEDYQRFKSSPGIPLNYRTLKRMNAAGLGGKEQVQPGLSIRTAKKGDMFLVASDGILDVFENGTTDEPDVQALETVLNQGSDLLEHVDNLREAAGNPNGFLPKGMAKGLSTYKEPDDKVIVGAEVK